jgi:hypothetical protein
VVLQDVADDAILIKVAASAFSAEVLAEDDLDAPDILSAPERFKDKIAAKIRV